jgi:transcriptional regulator with XRE-family HTH domain
VKSGFGHILSEWRAFRRMSQLDVALVAGVSQRHISFVESGRAQPSREMILKLAAGLDLPLRARNDLFVAAGYAPRYAERRLDLAEMSRAREALELILRRHEPYPAIVMDAHWNIVMQNAAAARIVASCVETDALRRLSSGGALNFMRLMFAANGLRPFIVNWPNTRAALLGRLRREAAANPLSPSRQLRRELEEGASPADRLLDDHPTDPMLALELRVGDGQIRLFSTFATFGTPQDVTLQELRIDMSFPADEPTRRWLVAAAGIGVDPALAPEATAGE